MRSGRSKTGNTHCVLREIQGEVQIYRTDSGGRLFHRNTPQTYMKSADNSLRKESKVVQTKK